MNSSKFAGLEIQVERPVRMPLVHPSTRQPLRTKPDGKEAYIEIYSADSEAARKHNRAIQRRRLNMRGRGRITPEELEAEAVELLAALTTEWLLVDFEGKIIDVPFNAENARELYAAPSLSWIREQVDEFAGDRGNFPQASSKS